MQWSAASVLAPLDFPRLLPLLNDALPPACAALFNGFLQSLGTILFLPHGFAGLLVAIALFAWSRLALVFALTGYLAGIAVVSALTELGVAFHGAASAHNHLLAGLALGAVYFVPSRASLALAALGGACAALTAAVVQRLLQGSGWEYLPLPFILTVWTLLCALRLRAEAGALDPAGFLRIGRSVMVNLTAVRALRPGAKGAPVAEMSNGTTLPVQRNFDELQERLRFARAR